jgi:hypothetical protein
MLEPELVKKEMIALQRHFRDKRDYVVSRLRAMGFTIKLVPDSTFVRVQLAYPTLYQSHR